LPPAIGQATRLQQLNLADNNLTDLPVEFAELKRLQDLDLSGNKFTYVPSPMLPKKSWLNVIFSHPLRKLKLRNNQLTELPDEFERLNGLELLDLSGNPLKYMPPILRKMTSLKFLHLDNTNIIEIPEWISELKKLHTLSISDNPLAQLPASIYQLKQLSHLYLARTQITSLPQNDGSAMSMPTLQVLDITDTKIAALPQGTKIMGRLKLGNTPLEILQIHASPQIVELTGFTVTREQFRNRDKLNLDDIYTSYEDQKERQNMLEWIGIENVICCSTHEEIDYAENDDQIHRLLRFKMEPHQPIIILSISNTNTYDPYLLRVPPHITTCSEAMEWMAQFDHPQHYNPLDPTE